MTEVGHAKNYQPVIFPFSIAFLCKKLETVALYFT
jgi:hypothetical protein